jgi:cell division protein FtsB
MTPFLQKIALLTCFALAGTYAALTFQGPHGIPALKEKRRQIAALQEENATLAAENQRLAQWVEKLDKDSAAQRLEIRKRLKLLQPGETQFMLPDPNPDQSTE